MKLTPEMIEQVQAMIDAAPPGEGAPIKSGESTCIPTIEKQVDFTTPFVFTPNVVITPVNTNWGVQVTETTPAYFKWLSKSFSYDIVIHWIATTAGNN